MAFYYCDATPLMTGLGIDPKVQEWLRHAAPVGSVTLGNFCIAADHPLVATLGLSLTSGTASILVLRFTDLDFATKMAQTHRVDIWKAAGSVLDPQPVYRGQDSRPAPIPPHIAVDAAISIQSLPERFWVQPRTETLMRCTGSHAQQVVSAADKFGVTGQDIAESRAWLLPMVLDSLMVGQDAVTIGEDVLVEQTITEMMEPKAIRSPDPLEIPRLIQRALVDPRVAAQVESEVVNLAFQRGWVRGGCNAAGWYLQGTDLTGLTDTVRVLEKTFPQVRYALTLRLGRAEPVSTLIQESFGSPE